MSHVQASVHNSENTLRDQIMDSLDDLIWSLALPNLTPLYFNAAATRVYQHSYKELMEDEHLWLTAIATDDRPKMQQAIAEAQETGSSKIIYHIQKRCFSARLKIFKDSLGIPIRLDAIAHEISDRNQPQNIYMEEVVLQSEQNYRQIIEQRTKALAQSEARNLAILHALPDLLLILKPDGTCVQCITPSTDNQSKYLPVQHHISEVLSPEGLETELKLYEKAIATGEVQIYEPQLSKFGKIVYEEVRIAPYCQDELLVIVRDITDRKVAEELLVKSDTHLKTAQRIGKIGSWEFDLQTGNVIWSEEVFRIFGRDPAIGTPTYAELQNTLHPDDWEYFDRIVQNAIATAQSYDIEYRVYWADGTLVDVLARGEIICDLEGKPIQIVGTVMDITDRKKNEQQLQDLSDRLTLAVKSAAIG
ncbi:MAG: PAS domain-containing protein, partial [Pseudanabaena sp. CAN_BIN31]|nr:PAS domain-containing protein [Pseudanabaena sp. CAN_BIN31]